MKVDWQSRAKIGKDQVAEYIREQFSAKRMKKFQQSVDRTVRMIMRHPEIGPIDPLFADRAMTYRSVIVDSLSKIVYRVDDDTIHIVAFWDCRRDPAAEADRVK